MADLRVLIVGGGVAGLSLAAKLARQGREPVVVEKSPEYGEHGYSLALYPFGSAVLHGLGAYDDLVAAGTEMKTYELADHTAEVIVGCDGIHSGTRELLFGSQPTFETGWVGWTWWGRDGIFPPGLVREYWLRGAFFGAYPVPGKSTFVAAVPTVTAGPNDGLAEDEVLGRLRGALGDAVEKAPEIAAALEEAHDLWPWPLADVRSKQLRSGRTVLCGDAGTAFLPTAGVGASSALRSAAALADELSRADARLVPLALDLYLKRTEKIIHGNQQDSRNLARAMFVENGLATWGRDELLRHMPVTSMTKSILEAMRQPV